MASVAHIHDQDDVTILELTYIMSSTLIYPALLLGFEHIIRGTSEYLMSFISFITQFSPISARGCRLQHHHMSDPL